MLRLTARVAGREDETIESYGDTRAELYGFVGWMIELHRENLLEVRAALEDAEDDTHPFWTPEAGFAAFDAAPEALRAFVAR